jgi:dipeptide/tripeptide permease
MAVLVWLIAWVVLHVVLRDRQLEMPRALTIALVLVGLGVLGTFPNFFQAFAAE